MPPARFCEPPRRCPQADLVPSSNGDRFLEHSLAVWWPQSTLGGDLDSPAQQILERQLQSGMVKEAAPRFEDDEEVHVAALRFIAARDRTEDANVVGSVATSDLLDLLTPFMK